MNVPLYKQLQESLKKQILSGVYNDGDLLPSEHELSAAKGVTRATVRQALEELVKENYIIKEKGRGSKVSRRRKSLGLLSVKGFSQVVGETKNKVNTSILSGPSITKWEDNFFYPLTNSEKRLNCIYVKRLRCVEDYPVMLENTYIPDLNLAGFCDKPFVKGSLFETLNVNHQIDILSVEQECRAILASEEIAKELKIALGSPILHLYLKFFTNRKDFNIYSTLYCNTEQYSIGNIL